MSALGCLLLLALGALAGSCVAAVVLPALRIRRALRALAGGDWQAPARLHPRGAPPGMAADLIVLGDRLGEMHQQCGRRTFNLRALLSSLGEGVLIVDSAQRIQLANDSLCRMFDLPAPLTERTLMEVFRDLTLRACVSAALKTNASPQSLKSRSIRGRTISMCASILP